MLVSEWATKYWEVSTVTKKTLYYYTNVFGRVISPQIGQLHLETVSSSSTRHVFLRSYETRSFEKKLVK